jgi:tetratricopeptide (TPR) repeat protein
LRAAQGYAQALALDRRHDTARAGLARIRRAHNADPLMKALVLAYADLGSGRLEAARVGFQQALRVHAADWRASQGLARADAALTAKRLAPELRRATLLEQNGNWAEALRVYEQILTSEPGYVLAQQGRQRVALRASAARDGPISVATGNTVGNGG